MFAGHWTTQLNHYQYKKINHTLRRQKTTQYKLENLCSKTFDKKVEYCGIISVVLVGSPPQQIDLLEKQI